MKIGYPDKWKDYSTLEIDPTLSYWENIQRASEWATRDQLAKVGKAVDPEEWLMTPQTVNAYYNPTTMKFASRQQSSSRRSSTRQPTTR